MYSFFSANANNSTAEGDNTSLSARWDVILLIATVCLVTVGFLSYKFYEGFAQGRSAQPANAPAQNDPASVTVQSPPESNTEESPRVSISR